MITPITPPDGKHTDINATTSWIEANKQRFADQLIRDGVLLFRNFPVTTASDFYQLLGAFAEPDEALLDYVGGASPREEVEEKVYTSTEAPPFVKILLHPEMCYLENYPTKLGFFCDIPAEFGGETPLADSRKIFKDLPTDLISEIEQKQVMYQRNLKFLGRIRTWLGKIHPAMNTSTWNHVYGTDDRQAVVAHCEALNQEYRWNDDGSLTTEIKVPATNVHPVTGDKVWFNTLHNFIHERHMFGNLLGPLVRLFRRISGEKFEIYFGDGAEIPISTKKQVLAIIDSHTWSFKWEKGDVLIIDNLLYWHGRNSFKGKRKILAGLIGKVERT